jgi:hypothetical protein
LANNGAAVISGPGDADVLGVSYFGTTPDRGQRQAQDDFRRMVAIVSWVYALLTTHDPDLVVVEWYAPRFRSKRGWTTILVVGAVIALCWVLGVHLRVAQPPREVQVARWPVGQKPRPQGHRPHILDALTHARLQWAKG